jgi:hypothetical protein
MKHIREYEEEEIRNLVSDLKSVGQSDWSGYFITYQLRTNDGIGAEAVAVVGESWEKIAGLICDHFNLDPEEAEIDLSDLKSIDDIMGSIDDHFSSDMSDYWMDFEFTFTEMNPRKLENNYSSSYLLALGKVIEMGKSFFTDFDSQVSKMKY